MTSIAFVIRRALKHNESSTLVECLFLEFVALVVQVVVKRASLHCLSVEPLYQLMKY